MDLPQLRDQRRSDPGGPARLHRDATSIRNVITALMSSAQIAPNFWIDPTDRQPLRHRRAVSRSTSSQDIADAGERSRSPPERSAARQRSRSGCSRTWPPSSATQGPIEVYHYEASRVSQLFVSVAGNDLAGVAGRRRAPRSASRPLEYALDKSAGRPGGPRRRRRRSRQGSHALPRKSNPDPAARAVADKYGVDPEQLQAAQGVRVEVRGEVTSMRDSFTRDGVQPGCWPCCWSTW